jgi:outer membrane protein assembly factor BamB
VTRTSRIAAGTVLVLALWACSSGGAPQVQRTGSASRPTGSPSAASTGPASWPAYHRDAARTGVSSDQQALGRVRRAWASPALDGAVYAQPLIVGNSVFVATEGNGVYALDASSGRVVWRRSLGRPVPAAALPCGNIDPSGITGTPVVDEKAGLLYVVAFLRRGPHHELFALELRNGATRWHRPIDPPGLSARVEQERGALALANGRIYVPFGGLFGDCGPYKGAVVSSATNGRGRLQSYIVPTTREAGIWTPAGPVVDASGDLWVSTGNSESRSSFDYGNAVIRLSPQLSVRDYFAPRNWVVLNAGDVDLGSVAPVLLPSNRIFAAGKSGIAYLLDRNDLGHIGGQMSSALVCSRAFGTAATLGAMVFLPCENSLVGIRITGRRIVVAWRHRTGAGPTIIAGGAVWSIGYDGVLRAFAPANGAVRFSAQLGDHESRFVSPAAARGRIFAPAGNKIVAFRLR